MILNPIWTLWNVWFKVPIKFSFLSSCLCLASTMIRLILSQNLQGWKFWISISLSFYFLFALPALWYPMLCILTCLCLAKLWSLSPQLKMTIRLFPPLPCRLVILSRKKARVVSGLTLFVSLLSRIIVVNFLLPSVLKHSFFMFYPGFRFCFFFNLFFSCLKC